jgi:DNA excision repair protein ERCC-2
LFVEGRTSTRYRDRDRSIIPIIDAITAMAESKKGNYIVFFPSYKYMEKVLEPFDQTQYNTIIQKRNMSYLERKQLLDTFSEPHLKTTLGFFVLGGSFSEGIDYVGDLLHGVMIVGVAFPMFNKENELLRSYFDNEGHNGFNYAYTYPGMNKVIQAVGRVIRRKQDQGIAILFDDRYLQHTYRSLYPHHWTQVITLKPNDFLIDFLTAFWEDKSS